MDVKIEEIGACRNRIQVTLPREAVQKAFDKSYRELQGNLRIKGFRPGKVPRSFLVRRFGEEVAKQLKVDLIEESLAKAIDEHKLEPIGKPDLDLTKVLVDPEQDFTFEAIVEVRPTFELPDYTGIEVERPDTTVTDEHVEAQIQVMRRRSGILEPIEEGAIGDQDLLVGKATLLAGDRKVVEDHSITVGPDARVALGILVPDLRAKAMEVGLGGTVTFDVTVPAHFPREEARGAEGKLIVQVEEAKRLVLPEVDDAFAQRFDFDDLNELREKVREALRTEAETEADRAVEERVIAKILEATPFSAPEGMLQKQMEQIATRTRLQLEYEGKSADEIDEAVAATIEKAKGHAESSLRATFLLDAIAKKEKIFVTEDELERRFEVLAAREGIDPSLVREYHHERNLIGELRYHMRDAKIRALLREKAKVG